MSELGATPATVVRRGRLLEWLRANPDVDVWLISQNCDAYRDLSGGPWTSPREGRPAKWRVA